MKYNKYLYLSIGLLFNQVAMAESFLETFQGTPKLNVNLYLFAADVDGSVSKGEMKYTVDQPFRETLKTLDSSFMAHADLSKGKWGLYADKQIVKTSQQAQVIYLPIAVHTKLDQSSYGVYYQTYISPEYTIKNQAKLIVEPTIGIHRTKAEATLTALNQSIETDAKWNEFFWGSRFKYNFNSAWNLSSEMTFGIENTLSAQAYIGYRIAVLNRDVNLRVGYRYFEQDYKSNDFQWDIRQHGPVVGINLPVF